MRRSPLSLGGWHWIAMLLAAGTGPAAAAPLIAEFMAQNDSGLEDEDHDHEDWIEILNPGPGAINLADYSLTDDINQPRQWVFPSTLLVSGQRVIVFASNKDKRDPGRELHTNFKLTSAGEYLGLFAPDGTTAVSQYFPAFPAQFPDKAYGRPEGS